MAVDRMFRPQYPGGEGCPVGARPFTSAASLIAAEIFSQILVSWKNVIDSIRFFKFDLFKNLLNPCLCHPSPRQIKSVQRSRGARHPAPRSWQRRWV
jgi:hypothetical protein